MTKNNTGARRIRAILNTHKTHTMNQHITIAGNYIDISVIRISYGTYQWTLYAGDVKLTAVNNNARDFDEFNDWHKLEPSYFGQFKRDLADYIAAMNGWSITFTA